MPYLTGTAPASSSVPAGGSVSTPQTPVAPGTIVGAVDLPDPDFEVIYDGLNVRPVRAPNAMR